MIPNFLINNKVKDMSSFESLLSRQSIQIQIETRNTIKVISYQVPMIECNINNEPYILNDETFFYIMLCKLIQDKSAASVKRMITGKCSEILQKIIYVDDLSVPKNLVNFFMYSFMLSEYEMCEKKNTTFLLEKSFIFHEGLETITKWIYPKTYEFYPETKALKFVPKSFLVNSVRVVDNGRFIGIVIGEETAHETLIKLFGTTNVEQMIDWRELPLL